MRAKRQTAKLIAILGPPIGGGDVLFFYRLKTGY